MIQTDIYDATALHICRNKDVSFKVKVVPIYNLWLARISFQFSEKRSKLEGKVFFVACG